LPATTNTFGDQVENGEIFCLLQQIPLGTKLKMVEFFCSKNEISQKEGNKLEYYVVNFHSQSPEPVYPKNSPTTQIVTSCTFI
jgi:hypothetical protein